MRKLLGGCVLIHEETVFEGHWPPSRYLNVDLEGMAELFNLFEVNGHDALTTPVEESKFIRFQTRDSPYPSEDYCVIPASNIHNYSYKKTFGFFPSNEVKNEWSFEHIDKMAVYPAQSLPCGVSLLVASRKEYVPADGVLGVTGYRMEPADALDAYTKDHPFKFPSENWLETQIEIRSYARPMHLTDIGLNFRIKVS